MPLPIDLTVREKQIALLITNGYTSSEIAKKLKLTKHTIETYRKRIMRKTKARNVAGLVTMMASKKPSIISLKNLFDEERKELHNLKRENKRLLKRIWHLEIRLAKKIVQKS